MKAAYHPDTVVATVSAARGQYISIFLTVLTLTYGLLVLIDFVPEAPDENTPAVASSGIIDDGTVLGLEDEAVSTTSVVEESFEEVVTTEEVFIETSTAETDRVVVDDTPVNDTPPTVNRNSSELPVRIEIAALNQTVSVLNPTSRRVADLDNALLSGVVRHPDSAALKQNGNMFLLGHSSRLPNVINKNFQAFNDIETLKWGDVIRVYSADTEYVYQVEKVYKVKASLASVPIAGDEPKLTLATCNSFGSKDDRHIVEADLISQRSL